jgi:hypothetical protein
VSCSMHDVLAFEDRGIPTVLLCTEPFMNSARNHAEAFGNPDYQAVRVGHPLASRTAEQARALADEALGGVIAILTGPTRHDDSGAKALHLPT